MSRSATLLQYSAFSCAVLFSCVNISVNYLVEKAGCFVKQCAGKIVS